jgi:hypothetical protein
VLARRWTWVFEIRRFVPQLLNVALLGAIAQ